MAEDIRTSTILNGRYQVQRILGEGGMGAVYLATDLQHRRPVAIKVALLEGLEARDQFRREAAFLKRLHHHSLPRVWDYFSDTQRDFLVMEYIPGEDLETLVHRQGPQPEWLVLRWADELLDGLDYLHNQDPPLIHRDIKPGNLKLRTDETLVLVDFGIAAELRPEQDTEAGALAVTPGFSPPEQYSDQPTDARTDVYSVGATLYFLLTGRTPPAAIDRADRHAQLDLPSKHTTSVSSSTDMLVRKALSLDPGERWASAAEMRHAVTYAAQHLVSVTGSEVVAAQPAYVAALSDTPIPRYQPKRRIGFALVLGLLAVALATGGLLALNAGEWFGSASTSAQEPDDPTNSGAAERAGTTELGESPAAYQTAPYSGEITDTVTISAAAETHTPTSQPIVGVVVERQSVEPQVDEAQDVPVISTSIVLRPAATPTPTSSPRPANTPTPTSTATPTPPAQSAEIVNTTPTRSAASQPAPPNDTISVSLISPAAGSASTDLLSFQWRVNSGALGADHAFEVRFWKQGQDPLSNGFGPGGWTQQLQQTISLQTADAALGPLFDPGEYLWGVLLVNTSPAYQAVRVISEAWTFNYQTGSSGPVENPTPTAIP